METITNLAPVTLSVADTTVAVDTKHWTTEDSSVVLEVTATAGATTAVSRMTVQPNHSYTLAQLQSDLADHQMRAAIEAQGRENVRTLASQLS